MSDLKNCPFCNSNKISKSVDKEQYIGCGNCKTLFVSNNEKFEELWNTRHSPWISSKDHMPEKDGRYLVVEEHWTAWVGVSSMRQGKFDVQPLYWQEIPEAPKEKKE